MGIWNTIKAKKEQLRTEAITRANARAEADRIELEKLRAERKDLERATNMREQLDAEKKAVSAERFKANNPLVARAVENFKKRGGEATTYLKQKAKENQAGKNKNPLYFGNQQTSSGGIFTQAGEAASGGIPGLTAPAKKRKK